MQWRWSANNLSDAGDVKGGSLDKAITIQKEWFSTKNKNGEAKNLVQVIFIRQFWKMLPPKVATRDYETSKTDIIQKEKHWTFIKYYGSIWQSPLLQHWKIGGWKRRWFLVAQFRIIFNSQI